MNRLRKGKGAKKSEDIGAGGISDFDFPNSASEEEEQAPEEAVPQLQIADEEGQEELEEPVRYMALKSAKLRMASDVESEEVGAVKKGDVVLVTHTKLIPVPEGSAEFTQPRVRLRCEIGSAIAGVGRPAGWVSGNNPAGDLMFFSAEDERKVYRAQIDLVYKAKPEARSPKASESQPPLKKGSCFVVSDVTEVQVKGEILKQKYFHTQHGELPSHPTNIGSTASRIPA
jgi:hypothetical protein